MFVLKLDISTWRGILRDFQIGSFFLPSTVFTQFLQHDLPFMLLDDVFLIIRGDMWFQLNNARAHFTTEFREFHGNVHSQKDRTRCIYTIEKWNQILNDLILSFNTIMKTTASTHKLLLTLLWRPTHKIQSSPDLSSKTRLRTASFITLKHACLIIKNIFSDTLGIY